MIREITEDDLPVILVYAEYFWTKTPYISTGLQLNKIDTADLLRTMQQDHYLRVYEDEEQGIVGIIGHMIMPFLFNNDYNLAAEMFFFVHPEYRGGDVGSKLVDQAEKDLKEMGVDLVSMSEMRSSKDMEKWYAKKGFTLVERSFGKVI